MQTMNQSLAARGAQEPDLARRRARLRERPDELRMMLEGKPVPPGGLRR
jgi:hypothetical protein